MTTEELLKKLNDVPEIIESAIDITEPNTPIKFFEGEFIIKGEKGELRIEGRLQFDWVPKLGARFIGRSHANIFDVLKVTQDPNEYYKVTVGGLEVGQAYISSTTTNSESQAVVQGAFFREAVIGDTSVPVEKLKFVIPNLRDFNGLQVKKIHNEKISTSNGRLRFEDDNHIILLDKCLDYKNRKTLLLDRGGYHILYHGELLSKKGATTYTEIGEALYCLNTFLTFMNGRRTSALLIQGVYSNETIWTNYSKYHVDDYKSVATWPQIKSTRGLNELWLNFSNIWHRNSEDKNFLTSVVHWYVEANSNTAFTEGSIVIAQTALELIYNWWIVENKKLIIGKDADNISAANKIRLLLAQLYIKHDVPVALTTFQDFIDSSKDISDAPDAAVQIRNAIVHSQAEKRKKLSAIQLKAKYEALQLCIWYIEMALLCILDYDGLYFNRCTKEKYYGLAEQHVPWTKGASK